MSRHLLTKLGHRQGKKAKQLMRLALTMLLTVVLTSCVSCELSPRAQTKVQRKPLDKQPREYKSPVNYEHRYRDYDGKTGKVFTYDHKPRVELLDAKAGKYAFKWIGYDGKEKTVIFQRGDAIDVIVSASVSKPSGERYLYSYEVQNLPSSATYLKRFVVQNFASDAEPDKKGIFLSGTVSRAIHQFREGNWLGFSDVSDYVQINPGQAVKVDLISSAPPGLVECTATTETIMEGVGEDMPSALENLLPGYEEFPRGYTIGPVDNLKTLSSAERIKYLLEKLPTFRKVGWMTDQAFSRYKQRLQNGNLNGILGQIDQDLKSEQITSEVFAIVQAMK